MATAMKMPTTTAITIHLRLIRTRMYSRSVDSCDGNTLYRPEAIGLRNSAGTAGCNSCDSSLFRGTKGPNDIVAPSKRSLLDAPAAGSRHRSSLQPDVFLQQARQTRAGCYEKLPDFSILARENQSK